MGCYSKTIPTGTPACRISLLLPLGSFRWLVPRLVKLHHPFAGAVQMIPIGSAHPVFPCQHSLIPFEQQRFGFGVFLLSGQARPQQAFGAVSFPVLGLLLASELEDLARQWLSFREPPLRDVDQCQNGRSRHCVGVFRAKEASPPRQGLRSASLRQGVFTILLVHGGGVRSEERRVGK